MKRKNGYIFFLIIFGLFASSLKAQISIGNSGLFLFTDRDYCISGDTVWFKVILPDSLQVDGNVVHVQLDSPSNNLISSVIKRSENRWAGGYVKIPDSLSTGVYFLTAFLNVQRNIPDLEIESRAIVVYNRFSGEVTELAVPELLTESVAPHKTQQYSDNLKYNRSVDDDVMQSADFTKIDILPNKNRYNTREKVSVDINFNELDVEEIPYVVVKATRIDDVAAEINSKKYITYKSANPFIPLIEERDGFLLSGKVVNMDGEPQNGVLILLSLTGDDIYFDYCVSGLQGDFHFFLKNAEGVANVVLQAATENRAELNIQIIKNYLVHNNTIVLKQKILTQEQTESIATSVNGNFFKRLFGDNFSVTQAGYKMPPRFSIPFYGKTEQRITPADFVDLPNFKEISRELLPGVQYREKNGEVSFRMLNENRGVYFENEPLRLINGIPVFKNTFFSSLNSTEIEYIEPVFQKRLYGDLIFNGVLSVSLKNKSNVWLGQQSNIFQFSVNCLQPDKKPVFGETGVSGVNMPDIRQVYYWDTINTNTSKNVSFILSDLKGQVEIAIEGVDKNNQAFKVSKRIEVQ